MNDNLPKVRHLVSDREWHLNLGLPGSKTHFLSISLYCLIEEYAEPIHFILLLCWILESHLKYIGCKGIFSFSRGNISNGELVCVAFLVFWKHLFSLHSCWLADSKENNDKKGPFYWSFILPMTIILTSNVALFIVIMVKVVWKDNQNLTR